MSRAVWKYRVRVSDAEWPVVMPSGARIVHVDTEGQGWVTFWAEHDGEGDIAREERRFVVHGTGHDIPDGHSHVGTVMQTPFVWHLYEITDPAVSR